MTNCIRCGTKTKNFPKPDNKKTCGPCLSELSAMHRAAEDSCVERGM